MAGGEGRRGPTGTGRRSPLTPRPGFLPALLPPTLSSLNTYIYIIYNIGLSRSFALSPFSVFNSISLFWETRLHNFFSQCRWGVGPISLHQPPGSPERAGTGWGDGATGPSGDLPCPRLGRSTWSMKDLAATTGTRQLLGARAHWPSRGRAVGHQRRLEGLGTLVSGKPRGLWALLPLRGLVGPRGWDRGRRVSGCTVQGAGGGACPSEGGLEVPNADQGLAGGRGLRYFAANCGFLRC